MKHIVRTLRFLKTSEIARQHSKFMLQKMNLFLSLWIPITGLTLGEDMLIEGVMNLTEPGAEKRSFERDGLLNGLFSAAICTWRAFLEMRRGNQKF